MNSAAPGISDRKVEMVQEKPNLQEIWHFNTKTNSKDHLLPHL